jgi:hypothetical protein
MAIKGRSKKGYAVTLIEWAGPMLFADSEEHLADVMANFYLGQEHPLIPYEVTLDGETLSKEKVEELHAEWVSRTREWAKKDKDETNP